MIRFYCFLSHGLNSFEKVGCRASTFKHFFGTLFPTIISLMLFSIAGLEASANSAEHLSLSINDYFELRRIPEIHLSSDGEMVVYTTIQQSISANQRIRTVYGSRATPGAKPSVIEELRNAGKIRWIPGTHEISYLSTDGTTIQAYALDMRTRAIRQVTHSVYDVIDYRFAPNGVTFAWTTNFVDGDKSPPLYDQVMSGQHGVVIDPESTMSAHFINSEIADPVSRADSVLWIKPAMGELVTLRVPGQVARFYWASDSQKLSVSYTAQEIPKKRFYSRFTSIGVYDLRDNRFQKIVSGQVPTESVKGIQFIGGEWIPGANKVLLRRVTEENSWLSSYDWAMIDVSTLAESDFSAIEWQAISTEQTGRLRRYGADLEPGLIPADADTIYTLKTVRARSGLYEVRGPGLKKASFTKELEGSISSIKFSDDFTTAVLVYGNLTNPAELYVWRSGIGIKQISHLNDEIHEKEFPVVREVMWASKDGASVHGWLLTPSKQFTRSNVPWPLLTFVHGGPGTAYMDEFGFQFFRWPYALEAYALNGIAVFIPNYRGTGTFGVNFAKPSQLDREPIDDVLTGIDYLIESEIADPERLAIAGYSHGAWLAPLIMTRAKRFVAASFAEGSQNAIVNYNFMAGQIQKEIIDVQFGVSPFDDPLYYIDISADFQFEGVKTAVLFEAGVKSAAVTMLGSPKAAVRAGMPVEFVVYPKTGHSMNIPRLQKESAERNFSWFKFWLLQQQESMPSNKVQH